MKILFNHNLRSKTMYKLYTIWIISLYIALQYVFLHTASITN